MISAFSIFQLVALIFSVMIHEVAHGYMANKLGDETAKLAGRLTFNPIKHIDMFGSILLPLMLMLSGSPVVLGWAKPVPYNPMNLYKDMKYGPLKVALAGPLSNVALLLVLGLIARFGAGSLSDSVVALIGIIAYLNVYLAIFNLVPIPPLDGSKLLPLILPRTTNMDIERVGFMGIIFVFAFVYFFSGIIAWVAGVIFSLVAGPDALFILNKVIAQFI